MIFFFFFFCDFCGFKFLFGFNCLLSMKRLQNQMMRVKYSAEPEKFMESEVELHAEINELYALAASPELYTILFDSGA
jgi:Catenin-beta-like, Arm-motif containing nuclear